MKIVSFVLVSIALLLAACSASVPVEEPTTPTEQPAGKLMINGEHAIVVTSQPAGANEVIVNTAVMGVPGFIMIHADANGRPGDTVAVSALLTDGGNMIRISMSSPLKEGETYFAMLHGDNGDGVFNEADDKPLTDADGNDVTMLFEVSADIEAVADIAI